MSNLLISETMKTIITGLVISLGLLFPIHLQAQEVPTYKHNLQLSFISIQLADQPFQTVLASPGILYRRQWNHFALRARLQASAYENVKDFTYPSWWSGELTSRQKSLDILLGGQYGWDMGPFQLYGFADIGYGYLDLAEQIPGQWFIADHQETIKGVKGHAGIGLQYTFAQRWQLGLESSAGLIYGSILAQGGGVELYDLNTGLPFPAPEPYWGSQAIFNPLSAFWIGYRFGSGKN